MQNNEESDQIVVDSSESFSSDTPQNTQVATVKAENFEAYSFERIINNPTHVSLFVIILVLLVSVTVFIRKLSKITVSVRKIYGELTRLGNNREVSEKTNFSNPSNESIRLVNKQLEKISDLIGKNIEVSNAKYNDFNNSILELSKSLNNLENFRSKNTIEAETENIENPNHTLRYFSKLSNDKLVIEVTENKEDARYVEKTYDDATGDILIEAVPKKISYSERNFYSNFFEIYGDGTNIKNRAPARFILTNNKATFEEKGKIRLVE